MDAQGFGAGPQSEAHEAALASADGAGPPAPEPEDPPRAYPVVPAYVERAALLLAILMGVAYAAATLSLVYSQFRWSPRVDFTMYHNAAQTALAHESLYHFHEPGGYRPGSLPYPYPPLLACLLAPFGKLPLALAYHLWVGVLLLSLGALVWMSASVVRQAGARRPVLLALGAFFLSFLLLHSNVYWGQVNIPVVALVAGGLLLWQRGRSGWAGALVGLAAAVKLLPAALGLWFLVRRDWRALVGCIGTFAAGVLVVPALLGGPDWALAMNREWLALLGAALTKGGGGLQSNGGYIVHFKNGSLVALLDRMFGGNGVRGALVAPLPQATIDSLGKLLRLTLFATSVAATVRLAARRAPAVERWMAPLAFSLLLLLGWLVNLLLWDHHTVGLLLILPVVAGAALDPSIPPGWRRPLWVALIAGASGLASGWSDASRRWGLQTLSFLCTWGGIAWALVTAPNPPATESPTPESTAPESPTTPPATSRPGDPLLNRAGVR